MWRFQVLRCVRIRDFSVGKMRMDQGTSVFVGMDMEQRSKKCGYNQQSHRVPREHFSHRRILTKQPCKVNYHLPDTGECDSLRNRVGPELEKV